MRRKAKSKLSPRERAEYAAWVEGHKRELEAAQRKRTSSTASTFWADRARSYNLHSERSTAHIPSAPLPPPEPPKARPEDALDYDERQAYLKREEQAAAVTQELKNRTAPAYNKGPSVYYSDGMLDSLKTGSHRRRS